MEYKPWVVKTNSVELNTLIQKLAFKLGYSWSSNGQTLHENYVSVIFKSDLCFPRNLIRHTNLASFDFDEREKVSIEEAVSRLLNDGKVRFDSLVTGDYFWYEDEEYSKDLHLLTNCGPITSDGSFWEFDLYTLVTKVNGKFQEETR